MAVTIELPGALRELAGGRSKVVLGRDRQVSAAPGTVGDALEALRLEFPAVYDRIVTERGEVRTHVNLFVGVEEIRHTGGLATRVGPEDHIVVLPAVSGG